MCKEVEEFFTESYKRNNKVHFPIYLVVRELD